VVYDTARSLHAALNKDDALLRLVGVRVEGLADGIDVPHQLALSGGEEEWRAAEHAVDLAAARFGSGAVRPAALVEWEQPAARPRDERVARSRDE
jgi:DNA polymerase-4